jgi:hypothetical protein
VKSTDLLVRAALLGVALSMALPVRAESPQSDTFFAEGRKLRLAGNCAGALVAFRRSFELAPERIGSLRNIAECERDLEKYAAARRSYWDLRRAAMKSTDPNYQGWDKDAEKAYDELTTKVSRLIVKLDHTAPGVTITIDGLPLDPRLIDVEIEQDLGAHSVEARYGAVTPMVEKVTLGEGEHRTLTIRIPAGAGTGADGGSGTKDALFLSSIAGFAVGGAGLVGMGIAAGVRGSALQTISEACPSLRDCPPSLAGELEKGRTANTVANVLGGVGAAGLVAGASLLVASRFTGGGPQKAAPPQTVSLSVSVVSQAVGLHLEGTF